MEKRLVTRYAMRSAEAADENQRRVEGVFVELAAAQPNNVSYIVLRLADDSSCTSRSTITVMTRRTRSPRRARSRTSRTVMGTAARVQSTSRPPNWSARTSRRSTEARSSRGTDLGTSVSRRRSWTAGSHSDPGCSWHASFAVIAAKWASFGEPSVRYRSSQRSAARSYFGDPRSA